MSKGFAFIELSNELEAKNAIEMFNNCIPIEFTDISHANYIAPANAVEPLKVYSK